ncbi:hypothetical protein M3M33_13480, partial [Loigolactobacillus coryniformis]|uniref:hypothetical protein n=1 Tax=Loigolactobacillus coryniformis TaxID=1610 RepID=UPI00201A3551
DPRVSVYKKLMATKFGLILVSVPVTAVIFSLAFTLTQGSVAFADSASSKKVEISNKKQAAELSTKQGPLAVLGSVFGLKDAKPKYQEVTIPKNIQTLSLLQAPKNI